MQYKYEKEINGKKITLEIFQDDLCESPREEMENFGHMVCLHRRYSLGDSHDINYNDFNSWNEIKQYLIKKKEAFIILPIYMYDHSGITISTSLTYPYNDRWDAGQIGFIYCTKDDIRNWFQIKYATKKYQQKALNLLLSEVEIYDNYLCGEVYGFKLYENEEEIDSCNGFYGSNFKENGILGCLSKDYKKIFEEVL